MCVLTEELNGLYERIARAVTSPESPELEADVVEGLLGNTATQQILPYLIQFVTAEVKRGGLRNPAVRRKVVTLLGKIICPEVNLSLTAPDFPDFPAAAAAAAATSTFTSASTSTPTSTMQPSQTQDAMMAEANPEAEGGSGNGSGGVSGNGYWYGGRFYIEPYMYQLVQVVLACIVTKDAECEYVDANCDATAARRDAARVLCYLCRRCYTYEGQAIAKVVTALAHVAENGARQPFARFGALVALATLGADAFAKCGLNAARDLVNAIESPSARIVPDVKAVLLAELLEYTEKALKDANATATAATVAATVTGEQVSMEERLKEMKGFILSKIEAIKKTKSEDLTASEPINEFS